MHPGQHQLNTGLVSDNGRESFWRALLTIDQIETLVFRGNADSECLVGIPDRGCHCGTFYEWRVIQTPSK